MAVDQTLKIEIRAAYESNNLSVSKILKRFPSECVSQKTVESWVTKEKWIKNRFINEKDAIAKLVNDTLPLEDAKNIIATVLIDDKNDVDNELSSLERFMSPEQQRKYAGMVGKELAYNVLHQNQLQVQMAENLIRSEHFAAKANNIGTVATHQALLISTFKAIHGEIKYINPETGNKIYTQEELENMTPEELDRLLD